MKGYPLLALAGLLGLLCLLLPSRITSHQHNEKTVGNTIYDVSFIPNLEADRLKHKRDRLEASIDELVSKPPPPCSDQQLENCLEKGRTLEGQTIIDALRTQQLI